MRRTLIGCPCLSLFPVPIVLSRSTIRRHSCSYCQCELLWLCLPNTSSPHYVHWALLRISRRPAKHHGPCGPSVSYCSPRWAQACRARRRSRLRTRRFVINQRSCSDRPAGARGCGPLTGCSGRGSVTCGPDGGERSSSSSPTPFSGGIDEGFGAIGAGRVGRADPVGHASRAPFKCSSARCATPTRGVVA